jgi:hypothetical protein
MTRKDFELVARTIKKLNFTQAHKLFIAESFADALTGTNAGFDRARFLKACGVAP